MRARNLAILFIPTFAAAAFSFPAGDQDTLAQALALQKQMEKIIAEAEPSIACILVSRNEAYHKARPPKEIHDPPALIKSFDFYKRAGELGSPEGVKDTNLEKVRPGRSDRCSRIVRQRRRG